MGINRKDVEELLCDITVTIIKITKYELILMLIHVAFPSKIIIMCSFKTSLLRD